MCETFVMGLIIRVVGPLLAIVAAGCASVEVTTEPAGEAARQGAAVLPSSTPRPSPSDGSTTTSPEADYGEQDLTSPAQSPTNSPRADEDAVTSPTPPSSSPEPSSSYTVDPTRKVIYLTFDDGPWIPYTQQILDTLATYNATATFFVVGEMANIRRDLIRKIKNAGHAIGNHTYRHPKLTTLSDESIREQIRATTDVVGRDRMGACMRPPYGSTDARVRSITRQEGYKTVLWSASALDWDQPPVSTMVDTLNEGTKDKANILLHDGGGERPNTVAAVQAMMPKWVKRGYTFEAVPACTKSLD